MGARIALVQMNFAGDDTYVEKAARLIQGAADHGAQIVCLPELATSPYFPFEVDSKWFRLAEQIPGPSTEIISAAARRAGAYVLFPLYEREQHDELYNTAVFIDPKGAIIGKYR